MKAKLLSVQSILAVTLFGCSLLFLAGCANEYSEEVVYKVRQDPLFPEYQIPSKKEFLHPDQPGQLPLRTMSKLEQDMDNEIGPYAEIDRKTELPNIIDPMKISLSHREQIKASLDGMFGSPQVPLVTIPGTSNKERLQLKLDPQTLARGSEVYRIQCLQCHGVTGNGQGYSAPWVNPHPRDYRLGLYKFQSTDQADGSKWKPLRDDLYRTLYEGVEGTSMPAFNLLPSDDLDALVSYVIHLSIRGESEAQLMRLMHQKGKESANWKNQEVDTYLKSLAKNVFKKWADSQTHLIKVGPYPYDRGDEESEADYHKRMKASILRGQALFSKNADLMKKYMPEDQWKDTYSSDPIYSALKDEAYEVAMTKLVGRADCVSCHLDYGRQSLWKFDEWGTLVKPRNITQGNFRGGRRPVDIYYRIHSGINGSGMLYKGDTLHSDQIWDLVNFVQAVPFEGMQTSFSIKLK